MNMITLMTKAKNFFTLVFKEIKRINLIYSEVL